MKKKLLIVLAVVLVMVSLCSLTVYADGDVASAVTNTWNSAKTQIKAIVNNVVFPIIDAVLAILLFVKISTAYFDYRKHGQFEWVPIAVVFGCLLFSMTCPLYVWEIAGI